MSEPALNRKFVEMAKLLNVYLNHFPKAEKYALANMIRVNAYEIYDLITEGQKKYFKKTTLTNLDISRLFKCLFDGPSKFFNPLLNLEVIKIKCLAPFRQSFMFSHVKKLFSNWSKNSFFMGPAMVVNPGSYDIRWDASLFFPHRDSFFDTINYYLEIGFSIVRLFFCCGPFAIIWRIPLSIIYSFYGVVFRWPGSHIFIKTRKRFRPFIANRYTKSPIPMERCRFGILAPLFHRIPYTIFSCFSKSMKFSFCFNHNRLLLK